MNNTHDRVNNFDAIRLLGALLVPIGHAFPLHGEPGNPIVWGGLIQVVGLFFFFSISGYLIATSWRIDPRFFRYLQKRALRIFPALAVVTVLSMFVLGPLLSRLSIGEYFSNSNLFHYFKNIALYPVYSLPGVFESAPIPNTVNASLWSLPAEFACYLVVPIVALLPVNMRSVTYLVLAVGCGFTAQTMSNGGIRLVVYGTDFAQAASVWPYFMVGAAIAVAPKILQLRLDLGLILLIGSSIFASLWPAYSAYVWWFVLPYVVIVIGSAQTPLVRRFGRFGDLSYGLYLFAFPIQQMLIVVAPNMRFTASLIATILLSFLCAFASWHLVEKRMLRFKPSPSYRNTVKFPEPVVEVGQT